MCIGFGRSCRAAMAREALQTPFPRSERHVELVETAACELITLIGFSCFGGRSSSAVGTFLLFWDAFLVFGVVCIVLWHVSSSGAPFFFFGPRFLNLE